MTERGRASSILERAGGDVDGRTRNHLFRGGSNSGVDCGQSAGSQPAFFGRDRRRWLNARV